MFRTLPPREGDPSPWGLIDGARPLGPDAVVVTTPSHGGIWISPCALARIPEPLRRAPYSGGGWFEEDCDWCIPYLALGLDAFEATAERQRDVRAAALRTLQACHAAHAALLGPAETSADERPEVPHG
jgi:hypothetical protein